VADSTKFGHTSLARLCPLEEIDVLVTDDEIPPAWRDRLAAAGVRLVVALAPASASEEPPAAPVPATTSSV
jgi:hypothetical protein